MRPIKREASLHGDTNIQTRKCSRVTISEPRACVYIKETQPMFGLLVTRRRRFFTFSFSRRAACGASWFSSSQKRPCHGELYVSKSEMLPGGSNLLFYVRFQWGPYDLLSETRNAWMWKIRTPSDSRHTKMPLSWGKNDQSQIFLCFCEKRPLYVHKLTKCLSLQTHF